VVKLKKRDQIDPMHSGFLHLIERLFGGRLYHCRYCRLQFFDRRELAPETGPRSNGSAVGTPSSAEQIIR
jgi:hypothetical protein